MVARDSMAARQHATPDLPVGMHVSDMGTLLSLVRGGCVFLTLTP